MSWARGGGGGDSIGRTGEETRAGRGDDRNGNGEPEGVGWGFLAPALLLLLLPRPRPETKDTNEAKGACVCSTLRRAFSRASKRTCRSGSSSTLMATKGVGVMMFFRIYFRFKN